MADRFTSKQRSEVMSRIGGKNTAPELVVRRLLHRLGYRFRLHRKDLPGNPDIVLPRYKTVVFVHGCFWHGHEGCKRATIPKTREEFWKDKISKNRTRDKKVMRELKKIGYRAITVWQCELRNESEIVQRLESVLQESKSNNG